MSGADFNLPGLQQGNYMSPYPLQQQVYQNKLSSMDQPNTENYPQGFNFCNQGFSQSTYDDIWATSVDATGQPAQAPVEESFSNSSNFPPALPAPTSTQPPADPALQNGVNVVGPWPTAPVAHATSATANEANLAALNAPPPSNAAQPTPDIIAQLCLENGIDPAQYMAFVAATNAMQVPATNEQVEPGLSNIENNAQGVASAFVNQTTTYAPQVNVQVPQIHQPQPLLNPELGNGISNIENNAQGVASTFVNQTTTCAPQVNVQVPQLHQLQPLLNPEFDNGTANNLAMGSGMNQSSYYSPNVNGMFSMGMAADGGFTPPPPTARPSPAAIQRRAQGLSQALRAAQAAMQPQPQPQRYQAPQSTQALQQTQFVQNPPLGTQYVLNQQMAMNGANSPFMPQPIGGAQVPQPSPTPAMVMNGHVQNSSVPEPTAFLCPPSMAITPGNQSAGQYRNVVTTNGNHQPLAAQPNPSFQPSLLSNVNSAQVPTTPIPAAVRNTPASVNYQAVKPNNSRAAMVMERCAQKSFEVEEQKKQNEILEAQLRELQNREKMRQGMVLPPTNMAGAPAAQPWPVPTSSAMVSTQPTSMASPAVSAPLPPRQVATRLQPTSVLANVEPMYDFNRKSGEFEDEWQQSTDFGYVPRVTLDLSQQQQQGFVAQAQAYPRSNGHDQVSDRGPREHHLGTLQQRQVEQVQRYGCLPQTHNQTNGYHYQQGDGGTAPSSSSSKRKRDEVEGQANTQNEVGEGPSSTKRQRSRCKDKGKGREVVEATTIGRDTQAESSKRTRDEAGDRGAQSSGSARPRKESPCDPEQGGLETLPMKMESAMAYLLEGRLCQWRLGPKDQCDYPIEPVPGAYWKHVKAFHRPDLDPEREACATIICGVDCNLSFSEKNLLEHLDTDDKHVGQKRLKCCACGEILVKKERVNPKRHLGRRNAGCSRGSKEFTVVEPAVTVVLPPISEPPEFVSQWGKRKILAEEEDFRVDMERKNNRNLKGKAWGEICRMVL